MWPMDEIARANPEYVEALYHDYLRDPRSVDERWAMVFAGFDLARQGVAVIVVSSDLEEVLGVSSRIMVMAQGKQAGILNREDANDVSVMELATT